MIVYSGRSRTYLTDVNDASVDHDNASGCTYLEDGMQMLTAVIEVSGYGSLAA